MLNAQAKNESILQMAMAWAAKGHLDTHRSILDQKYATVPAGSSMLLPVKIGGRTPDLCARVSTCLLARRVAHF